MAPRHVSDHPDESSNATAAERASENADLQGSLTGLSRIGAGQGGLKETLTQIAQFAVRAIPGAEGAGLTLLERNHSDTIVATQRFVSAVDDIQYGIGEGPCISAAAGGHTVLSGSLGADSRWPRFGPKVARLGVHSAVSLPLIIAGRVVGAMNVYARPEQAFDERAAELGELFATPAAVAVQNAQVLSQTQKLAEQLQRTLRHRVLVERAVGIIMSRSGVTPSEALLRLRTLSQNEHLSLTSMAESIVEEAVRRARARHSDD